MISSLPHDVTFKCDFRRELVEFSSEITLKGDIVTNWRNVFVKTSNYLMISSWLSHMHVYLHICGYSCLQRATVAAWSRCPSYMRNPHINHQQKIKLKIGRRQSLRIHLNSQTKSSNIIRTSFLVTLFLGQTFVPEQPQWHFAHACISDILMCVVVEGGPNAAQAPRWVRNKEAQSGMGRLEVSDRRQTIELA